MKSYRWTKVTLKRGNIKRVKRVRPTVTLLGEKNKISNILNLKRHQ